VDAAGYVGDKLGDEVVNGSGGQAYAITLGTGRQVGSAAGNVEVADCVVDGKSAQVGVVHHAPAVVALRPRDLVEAVSDAPLDGGIGHAVVVRVLVGDGRDEKSAEKLASYVLRKIDAHKRAKAEQPRSVDGVRVDANGYGGGGQDGCGVEWVAHIAHGQPGLLFRRHRLDLRAVEEPGIPVSQRNVFNDGQFSGESGIEALGLLLVRGGGGCGCISRVGRRGFRSSWRSGILRQRTLSHRAWRRRRLVLVLYWRLRLGSIGERRGTGVLSLPSPCQIGRDCGRRHKQDHTGKCGSPSHATAGGAPISGQV